MYMCCVCLYPCVPVAPLCWWVNLVCRRVCVCVAVAVGQVLPVWPWCSGRAAGRVGWRPGCTHPCLSVTQELCRQRMTTRAPDHPEALHTSRISSVSSQFSDGPAPSPSARSSTSSWSEEPAQPNMDISTGHMVLVRPILCRGSMSSCVSASKSGRLTAPTQTHCVSRPRQHAQLQV